MLRWIRQSITYPPKKYHLRNDIKRKVHVLKQVLSRYILNGSECVLDRTHQHNEGLRSVPQIRKRQLKVY